MYKLLRLVMVLPVLFSTALFATVIQYELVELDELNNRWEYRYTVINDEAFEIKSITILFDSTQFTDLVVSSLPIISSSWDEIVFSSLGMTYYDSLADSGVQIGVGQSLSGFAVSFTYTAMGLPASQEFEIYDPEDYSEPLATGWTTVIPEPATLLLFATGISILASKRRCE